MKNKIRYTLVLAAAAAVVGLFPNNATAQDEGRAQRRQEMLNGYLDRLDVKSEEDRKKIEVLIGKVSDAQREARMGGGFGFGGGNRTGGGGGGGNRGGREPSPEYTEMQKAIEEKAPADEIKAKLAKYREARKTKEAALEKAQEELRKALTPRQEAAAVLAGLLK